MWANPPDEVLTMRSMLLASATVTTLGIVSGSIHYPSAAEGDSPSNDSLPMIVIEPVENTPKILSPGIVLPGGKIQCLLYVNSTNAATAEATARNIANDVALQVVGLPIVDTRVGMSNEPDGQHRAAQEDADEVGDTENHLIWCISIQFTFGLQG